MGVSIRIVIWWLLEQSFRRRLGLEQLGIFNRLELFELILLSRHSPTSGKQFLRIAIELLALRRQLELKQLGLLHRIVGLQRCKLVLHSGHQCRQQRFGQHVELGLFDRLFAFTFRIVVRIELGIFGWIGIRGRILDGRRRLGIPKYESLPRFARIQH